VLLGSLFRSSYQSRTGSQRYDANPTIHLALAVAIDGGRVEEARHIATAILARGEATADTLEAEGVFWGAGAEAEGRARQE
jgi:GntR family transcriptional regulator, galactonate operon transcriptional repressor